MSSKLIFLLLTALLLVQCSVGGPIPDDATATEVSKKDETIKEGKAEDLSHSTSEETPLESFLIGEFTELAGMILTNVKKLIEDVVADVTAMEEKSEALTIKIDKFTKLITKLDKIDSKDKKQLIPNLELLKEMSNLLIGFGTEMPNAEDLIIEASLKKNGIEKIKEDVKTMFLEFNERLYVAAEKYWDSLSPEEQTEKKAFAEWLKLFKGEADIEEKSKWFRHIFEIDEKLNEKFKAVF